MSAATSEKGCGCAGEEAARAYAARQQAISGEASCSGGGGPQASGGAARDGPVASHGRSRSEIGLLSAMVAGGSFAQACIAGIAVLRPTTDGPISAVSQHGASPLLRPLVLNSTGPSGDLPPSACHGPNLVPSMHALVSCVAFLFILLPCIAFGHHGP